MAKTISALAVLMTLAIGGVAHADESETWHDRMIEDRCSACPECCVEIAPPVENECEDAVALDFKSRAPCTGLLIPRQDAINALRCIGSDLPLANASLLKCEKFKLADLKLHKASIDAQTLRISELEKALAVAHEALAEEPSIFESPILWGIVGVTVGITAGVLVTAYTIR